MEEGPPSHSRMMQTVAGVGTGFCLWARSNTGNGSEATRRVFPVLWGTTMMSSQPPPPPDVPCPGAGDAQRERPAARTTLPGCQGPHPPKGSPSVFNLSASAASSSEGGAGSATGQLCKGSCWEEGKAPGCVCVCVRVRVCDALDSPGLARSEWLSRTSAQ